MPELSRRVQTFTDSVIRRMTRINNMTPGSINLSQGFPDFDPPQEILEFAAQYPCFELTDDPKKAAVGADVVITDVWTSMGQEEERQKREAAFAGYCVDEQLMAQAKPDAMVQHCLPAHRGEEITEEVFEANAQYIFEEAENRLHAQKAVLVKTMGGLQDK